MQPWSSSFSTLENFSQNVVIWVRIPCLPGSFYKKSLLQEIRSMVGKIIKVDMQTDKGSRGQFARFAVQVDLSKPLVSKIRVASRLYRIEYESLPSICFQCGRFSHLKDVCPNAINEDELEGDDEPRCNKSEMIKHVLKPTVQQRVETEEYDEWMVVERRPRHQGHRDESGMANKQGKILSGSRFNILSNVREKKDDLQDQISRPLNFGRSKNLEDLGADFSGIVED